MIKGKSDVVVSVKPVGKIDLDAINRPAAKHSVRKNRLKKPKAPQAEPAKPAEQQPQPAPEPAVEAPEPAKSDCYAE